MYIYVVLYLRTQEGGNIQKGHMSIVFLWRAIYK